MDQLVDMKLSAERHWHKSTLVEMEELHAADKARVTKTLEELQKEALKAMQKTYEAKLALKTQEAATAQATLATAMKDSGKSASQVRVGFQASIAEPRSTRGVGCSR
jgi:predicted phosphohydrolase